MPYSLGRRVFSALADPKKLRRILRRFHAEYEFRRTALRSRPVIVPPHHDVEVHVLFGHVGVLNAVATLKSLYRFLSDPYSLVVHDDGTLTPADAGLVRAHFPGVRIIERAEADRAVAGELRRRSLDRCGALREQLIFSLKLFDVQYYGVGRSVLYIDTDILFHRVPTELMAALEQSPRNWVDRYNEDIFSAYAWPEKVIFDRLGIRVLPRVNAGMICLRREDLDWSLFERSLSIPKPVIYLAEQTLNAIDISRRGGRALPPEYDVAFRHKYVGDYEEWLLQAPAGHEVITQHYCGSMLHRRYYFEHYVRHVAPALRSASPHGSTA